MFRQILQPSGALYRVTRSVGNYEPLRQLIVAPQAQLEESANDRSKPEVPFSRVLKRDPLLVFGATFERFYERYLTFSCPKHDHIQHRNRTRFLCLFVCLSFFFVGPFFDDFCEEFIYNFRKITLKKRVLAPVSVGEANCFGSGTTSNRRDELDDVERQDL